MTSRELNPTIIYSLFLNIFFSIYLIPAHQHFEYIIVTSSMHKYIY
jgi:hypothetical protein